MILAVDGHDIDAVSAAVAEARADTSRPSLIKCRTVIGYGAPKKAGTAGAHGAPLGDDVGLGEASELGLGEPPRERVLALQRELLELEARLDAAHGDARKARDSGKAAAAELASIKAKGVPQNR